VVPASLPIALNTTDLAAAAPQLLLEYPGMWVDVNVSLASKVSVNFAHNPAQFTAPIALDFIVEDTAAPGVGPDGFKPTSVFTLGCNMSTALSVGIQRSGYNQTLRGNLSYIECPVHVVSSNVGPVTDGLLKTVVDVLLPDVILPALNILFNTGLPLPHATGLNITDTVLDFDQGFVDLGTDFTWNPNA